MKENTNIFQIIKNYYKKLDVLYNINSIRRKDTISVIAVILFLIIFSYKMMTKSQDIDIFIFSYLLIISILTLLLILALKIYDCPPSQIRTRKKAKTLLKIIVITSVVLFFLSVFPVLILIWMLNFIASIFHIEIFIRYIDIVLINSGVYLFAYLFCLICYIRFTNTIFYMSIILFICLVIHWLRSLFLKIFPFISYRDKYDYLRSSKKALTYIATILTVFSGIAGLYFSKTAIFYILPLIIFSGIEQLSLIAAQSPTEKNNFIKCLYDELKTLNDIAYPQIIDFSCIKLKIQLSIKPYTIENYIQYFEIKNSNDILKKFKEKNRRKLIDILKSCKTMLLKEYAVYQVEEKKEFEKNLTNVLENLAQYLTEKA